MQIVTRSTMYSWLFLLAFLNQSRAGCFDQPLQVLRPNSEHDQLLVNEEGLQQLLGCLEQNISLVGVVGPYHSGKSFLLNQMSGKNAFKVGPTVQPETLGIWMLPTEDRSRVDGSQVVLMDTEGFFGTDVAESYDANIFAITALLSSHLVYNSIKLIDQSAVDYLELLAQRTRLFGLRSLLVESEKGTELTGRFPPLTWVVEDFTQNLDNATPDSWLRGFLDAKRDANQPDGLSSVFDEVYCETLFLPATSLTELQDLSRVKDESLTLEFTRGVRDLRGTLYSRLSSKKLFGSSMGPSQLVASLRFLIESSNRRKFPELPNYWGSWIRNLTESAKADTAARLRQLYEERLSTSDALSDPEFEATKTDLRERVTDYFRHLVFDVKEFYEDPETSALLSASLMALESEYAAQNTVRARRVCKAERDRAARVMDGVLTNLSRASPQNGTGMLKLCSDAVFNLSRQYYAEVGRFSGSQFYKDELEVVVGNGMLGCGLLEEENKQMISHSLASAAEAAKTAARDVFARGKSEKKLFTDDELSTKATNAKIAWTEELESQIQGGPLAWMDRNAAELELVRHEIKKAMIKEELALQSANEVEIWAKVVKEAEKGVEDIRVETRRTLPQSKRVIREQLDKRRLALVEMLLKFYAAWGKKESRDRKVHEWTSVKLALALEELTAENTRIYERMFGGSTRQCRRDLLRRTYDECPYCRWLTPWNNRVIFTEANLACLSVVEKDEKLVIPAEVKAEMLDVWESEELDRTPVFVMTATAAAFSIGIAMRILAR